VSMCTVYAFLLCPHQKLFGGGFFHPEVQQLLTICYNVLVLVCVYVCVYGYVRVFEDFCTMCVFLLCVCACRRVLACVHVCVWYIICIHGYIHMILHIHMAGSVFISTNVDVCVCVCACMYLCICMYMHTYTYTYTYIYTTGLFFKKKTLVIQIAYCL